MSGEGEYYDLSVMLLGLLCYLGYCVIGTIVLLGLLCYWGYCVIGAIVDTSAMDWYKMARI